MHSMVEVPLYCKPTFLSSQAKKFCKIREGLASANVSHLKTSPQMSVVYYFPENLHHVIDR